VRRRGRRVVTPDGHVWFVRRRRARRRPFWAGRRPERFHGEDELPDPDEKIPLPGPLDLFTTRGRHLGELGFRRVTDDDRQAAATAGWAILATTFLVGLVVWLTVRFVLPWLVPLVAANARPLATVAAALVVLAALNQLHRPWYVELQRQGLADAPRRVWRVQGWRRSGRLLDELTAAIHEGRIDNQRAVILRTDDRR
jgi:hypothetical protein